MKDALGNEVQPPDFGDVEAIPGHMRLTLRVPGASDSTWTNGANVFAAFHATHRGLPEPLLRHVRTLLTASAHAGLVVEVIGT